MEPRTRPARLFPAFFLTALVSYVTLRMPKS